MTLAIIIGVGLEGMAAYWALTWALSKSNALFFSVFVGDAFLKLMALGGLTAWLLARHLPYTQPLVALAVSFVVVSLIQVPFFQKVR